MRQKKKKKKSFVHKHTHKECKEKKTCLLSKKSTKVLLHAVKNFLKVEIVKGIKC